jgi:hypothetical protein
MHEILLPSHADDSRRPDRQTPSIRSNKEEGCGGSATAGTGCLIGLVDVKAKAQTTTKGHATTKNKQMRRITTAFDTATQQCQALKKASIMNDEAAQGCYDRPAPDTLDRKRVIGIESLSPYDRPSRTRSSSCERKHPGTGETYGRAVRSTTRRRQSLRSELPASTQEICERKKAVSWNLRRSTISVHISSLTFRKPVCQWFIKSAPMLGSAPRTDLPGCSRSSPLRTTVRSHDALQHHSTIARASN